MSEYVSVRTCRTGLSSFVRLILVTTALLGSWACQIEEPLLPARVIVAEFDPTNGIIPTPNDLLTDRETGLIAIPSAPEDLEGKSAVEIELIAQLNQRRAWSTRTEAKLTFSGALDPASVTDAGLKVYEVTELGLSEITPVLRGEPADAPTQIVIEPPTDGWRRGGHYVVAALGAEGQLRGKLGEPVVSDAAFWYLRLQESLLEHTKAMPGDTEEERLDAAEQLEQARQDLAPHFDELAARGTARESIAQLWSFKITSAPQRSAV